MKIVCILCADCVQIVVSCVLCCACVLFCVVPGVVLYVHIYVCLCMQIYVCLIAYVYVRMYVREVSG